VVGLCRPPGRCGLGEPDLIFEALADQGGESLCLGHVGLVVAPFRHFVVRTVGGFGSEEEVPVPLADGVEAMLTPACA
jgi:hypothetical protein